MGTTIFYVDCKVCRIKWLYYNRFWRWYGVLARWLIGPWCQKSKFYNLGVPMVVLLHPLPRVWLNGYMRLWITRERRVYWIASRWTMSTIVVSELERIIWRVVTKKLIASSTWFMYMFSQVVLFIPCSNNMLFWYMKTSIRYHTILDVKVTWLS